MARILVEKSESSFRQVIRSAGVRRCGETQQWWYLAHFAARKDRRTAGSPFAKRQLPGCGVMLHFGGDGRLHDSYSNTYGVCS